MTSLLRITVWTLRALTAAFLLAATASFAQDAFPSKPIRIIVAYPAGGIADYQVRAIQEPLGRLLGQPVIVENRPGASGAIASVAVKSAPPDGYTLLHANNAFVIAPLLTKQIGYDPMKDLASVGLVATMPMVLLVSSTVPANTVGEFIAWVKAQPSGVHYGSSGAASYGHLATVLFSQSAGLQMTHVPYKGEAPMALALRAGEVKTLITTPSGVYMNNVKEGHMKLLGVASSNVPASLAAVKPISDALPGYTAEAWFGLFAPAGTPPAVAARINGALREVLAAPEMREKLAGVGAVPGGGTPAEFGARVQAEHGRWAELIPKADIKAD